MVQPPPPECAKLPDLGLRPRPGRPWIGLLVAVGGLALVAVPAFWTFLLAYAGFSGCFLECSTPNPPAGTAWALVTLLLVAAPVVAGVAVARPGPIPRGVWVLGAVALLAVLFFML